MTKITLFFPTPFPYHRPYKGTPLGLLAASRVLVRDGYDVAVLARHLQDDVETAALEHARDSVCFGVSAMTGFQVYDGLKIARLVRSRFPKLPIVWGGWHPSILPEETLRDPNVDYVVRGCGDRTLAELVAAIETGKDPDGIAGVWFKRDGKTVSNPDRPHGDLNELPPVPYHLVDLEKCLYGTEMGRRTLPYISSYGCPHRCAFCVEPIVNRRAWAAFSGDRVVEEWETLVHRFNVDSFAVIDSNFFVDEKRVHTLCEGLLRKGLKIRWGSANGRVPQLVRYRRETWELMEKSGCTTILTGSESGSQEALDMIHKDMKVEEISTLTELCKKYHIKIFYSFMVGLPWSKDSAENRRLVEKEFSSTIGLIDRLYKICPRNRFMYYTFLPYPGAPLHNKAVELGLNAPTSLEDWGQWLISPDDAFRVVTGQKWITPHQVRLTAMLTQYIFGVLDHDSYSYIRERSPNAWMKLLYTIAYGIARLLVAVRWKLKWFGFPVDYWVFTRFYKHSGLV